MVRPRKLKFVNFKPEITYFKPQGMPLRDLEEIELTIDELETLRLANYEKLSQIEAAAKMDIHQSTFQRTLTRAREKITDALINGKAIKIQGGEIKTPNKIINEGGENKMPKGDRTGPEGKGPRTGRRQGLCSGSDKPGFKTENAERQGMGRGAQNGQGRGKGLGRRNN